MATGGATVIPALGIERPLDGDQGVGVGVEQGCYDLERVGSIVVADGQLEMRRIRWSCRSMTSETEGDLHLDQSFG
ncbi:MAG TPA: hypothetical protein VN375_13285 [Vicinamibacteria bacterium]|nr:hypothetical protein [Vicinamibacteria bacterium]